MKKYILFMLILAISYQMIGQVTITPGSQWVNDGNVTVTFNNQDLIINGTFTAGTSNMRFIGNQNSTISGSTMPAFSVLEIAKTNGTKVSLNKNISVNTSLNFISGQLDLNGNNIMMNTSAMIAGESENNRIIGTNGGFVEITLNMNAPASVNAGNLGATITSSTNMGSVTIRRGHIVQTGTGLSGSINRYYLINPANNSGLNATLRLKYFDTELNGQNENSMVIYKSDNNGTDWNNMSQTTRNTNANYVEKTGMNNLTLQTLANDNVATPDGATGIVLTGQRKKTTEVTLKWNSQTETNMSGYQIQRRLKNEADFSDRVFVNTLAPGGNSASQLSYQNIDANSYTDTTYYRLKIVTNSASVTYSNVIAVSEKTKGGGGGNGNGNNSTLTDEITTTTRKPVMQFNTTKKITVGPNPNNGNFWFSVNGIQKETIATLYTIDGKQINQFRVVNLQQHKVNNLSKGIYLLKVAGFETQKIIVNGAVNGRQQSTQIITDNIKL